MGAGWCQLLSFSDHCQLEGEPLCQAGVPLILLGLRRLLLRRLLLLLLQGLLQL